VRHSAGAAPWADASVHSHLGSEEYYLVLEGRLWLLIEDALYTVGAGEMAMVKPGVPHAVAQGEGPIEHFGLRAPAPSDRSTLDPLPAPLPPVADEAKRELRCDWGDRVPLQEARNQNRWLFGRGAARFLSSQLVLAYLDFPTDEAANAGIGSRHCLHLHRESWEFYVVLQGTKTLQLEGHWVTIQAGQMLEVPPGVRHTLAGRQAPYQGFTFRVPLLAYDDKVEG